MNKYKHKPFFELSRKHIHSFEDKYMTQNVVNNN